jgi:hypothetical protein
MKKFSIKPIGYLLIVIFFFLYSYFLSISFTLGDQLHYRSLYETFSETLLQDILVVGGLKVGSIEPLTLFLLWVGAKLGIDKDIYISFWNVTLLLGLVILARKYKMSFLLILLLLTNYYVIVLMTGAERLKFAMIFLTYSFIFFETKKVSYGLVLISPLAHFQSLIFITGYISHLISGQFLRLIVLLKVKKTALFLAVFFLVFTIVFFVLFGGALISKFDAYFDVRSFASLFNILLLSIIVLTIARNKFAFFPMLSVMSVFVFFLGGERVNMIAFFLSLFFLILERRADHPLFLILMLYFSIKSIPFVNNIVLHGNGYHGCC